MNEHTLPLLPGSLPAVLDVSPDDFRAWLAERGQAPLRLGQIRRWLLVGRAASFDTMTDLPLALRAELAQSFRPFSTTVERTLISIDGTHKLLLRAADGHRFETVLLQEANRRTVCISTQVGCGMGCVFCASGLEGVVRNLRSSEIIEQLLQTRNLLPAHERLTHIVVMGMGEPMANLDNLMEALAVATTPEPKGLGLSARHITVSTVGLPARMRQFADLRKQYGLAVSLHAPNDELRNAVVPTNEKIGLGPVLDAADYFHAVTGRQVTYEYVLLGGINDEPAHAAQLARLLRGKGAHVNLIPFNDVEGLPYRRLSQQALDDFLAILRGEGVSVKVRKRKGADIDAACGQLRRSALRGDAELLPTAGV
jgi:23S rRNA (adenine2503-C2)-methyltransferase